MCLAGASRRFAARGRVWLGDGSRQSSASASSMVPLPRPHHQHALGSPDFHTGHAAATSAPSPPSEHYTMSGSTQISSPEQLRTLLSSSRIVVVNCKQRPC
jgi:hypothetical protein